MRIIQGPDPWARVVDCKCETIVAITQTDIKVGYFGSDYTERGERKYYIECPTCGKVIILNSLPTHVKVFVDRATGK